MQRIIKAGHAADAGLIFHIFAMDSTSTSGAGKASVAYSSFSCRYIRAGGAISGAITPEDITTIGTYAAPTANTNIRIKAVDNTNMIGIYEVHIHLDWVATGSEALTIYLTASGVAPIALTIPLTLLNVQDSVRAGLTALPNAAADAAGGLPISDAGGLDLDAKVGALTFTVANKVDANATHFGGTAGTFASGRPEVNTSHIAGSAVSTSSAQIGVNVVNAGGTAWGSGAITAASIAADAITAAKVADGTIDAATFAAGAITAAAIAADAIGASELAADAVTEIQSGLSTLTAAGVRTAVGLASANLDTQLAAIQTDTDAIEVDTQDIQARLPAALTGDGNIKADILRVGGTLQTAKDLGAINVTNLNTLSGHDPGETIMGATDAITVTTNNDKTGYALSSAGILAIWEQVTSGLTAVGSVGALVVALGSRLGAWTGTGVNTVLGAFKALLSKAASTPSDIGGTFDATTDSTEAIRDRGDAGWTTATGFSTHSAADVWSSATRVLTAGTNIVLPSNGLSNVTAWTVNLTGNLSGSVGSVTGNVGGDVTGLSAVYQATISYIKDDAAAQDEWTVQFFKNGVPLTSGITSPTLTVKNSSGTTIINAGAMTQIGSTGVYKYDAVTTERVSAGIVMIATAAATIDAGARSFTLLKGRDTTA